MKCLDCRATPEDGKCAVFLVCEDYKGKFGLCSGCWIIRDGEQKPTPEEPPKKKKRRRKKR